MKVDYYKITPGGNGTVLVTTPVPATKRKSVAKKILLKEKKMEQVGFVVSPKNTKASARLEMAGGEFCGNALRALGVLAEKETGTNKILLETSTSDTPLIVTVGAETSTVTLPLSFFSQRNNICHLPGISHTYTLDTIDKKIAKQILSDTGLINKKAAGVLSYKKLKKNTYSLSPFVWVNDIRTLYEETACASGTFALAYMLFKKEGLRKIAVHQVSGSTFQVQLKADSISLTGPKGAAIRHSIIL